MTHCLRDSIVIVFVLSLIPRRVWAVDPQVKVITHNLAGIFCKMLHFKQNSLSDEMKYKAILDEMKVYKTLAFEDAKSTPDVVIFHFQEVCEAKFVMKLILDIQTLQDKSHELMFRAVKELFENWNCEKLISKANFASYVCANVLQDFSEVDIIKGSDVVNNLTNDWDSVTLNMIARVADDLKIAIKVAWKKVKSWFTSKANEPTEYELSSPENSKNASFSLLNLLTTKGSLVVPFKIKWSSVANTKPIVLWVISANVHFSSKKIDHRRKKFKKTYKDLVAQQKKQRAEASSIDDNRFFGYLAGDFNSRVFHQKGNQIEVFGPEIETSSLRSLLLCLLFQRKIGQSFYGDDMDDFEKNTDSSKGKYYKICGKIYQNYLDKQEEFRASAVAEMTKSVWGRKSESLTLIEPKLQGLVLPTFAYNVFADKEKKGKDYFQETLSDIITTFNEDESGQKISKTMKKNAFKTIFNHTPKKCSKAKDSTLNEFGNEISKDISEQEAEMLFDLEFDDLSNFFDENEQNSQKITNNPEQYSKSFVNVNPNFKMASFKTDTNQFLKPEKALLQEKYIFDDNTLPPENDDDIDPTNSTPSTNLQLNQSIEQRKKAILDQLEIEKNERLLQFSIQLEHSDHETPAWCDRLMYLREENSDFVQAESYQAHHKIRMSDHVPVTFSGVIQSKASPKNPVTPETKKDKMKKEKFDFKDIYKFANDIYVPNRRLAI